MYELIDILYELGEFGEMLSAFFSCLTMLGPLLGIMGLASYFVGG